MSDMYDSDEFWSDHSLSTIEDNIRKGKWQCANGNLLTITSMETSHIINCQNLIKRKSLNITYAIFNEYLELFASELANRQYNYNKF